MGQIILTLDRSAPRYVATAGIRASAHHLLLSHYQLGANAVCEANSCRMRAGGRYVDQRIGPPCSCSRVEWKVGYAEMTTFRRISTLVGLLVVTSVAFGAWTQAGAAPARTVKKSSTTTIPESTVTPTVLPVGSCTNTSGVASTGPLWVPTKLIAVLSPANAASLEFYSVGTETLLGPRGWSCAQLAAADGSSEMAVYPPGVANPTEGAPSSVPSQGIYASFDYTGHVPGLDLVCAYFPSLASSSGESCPSTVPATEQTNQLTPDVVAITDPAGVRGSLRGSGGSWPVTGFAVAPQAADLAGGEDVAMISCSMRTSSLCQSILGDFIIRDFPVPKPSS
jgi:hypothetical protein